MDNTFNLPDNKLAEYCGKIASKLVNDEMTIEKWSLVRCNEIISNCVMGKKLCQILNENEAKVKSLVAQIINK